ncbi:hypothetical protein [uncultured Arcobacter sp.]|uniref:hypothetical protein n=1 Tax=uncultured Arcobacter sp. TaxID=165434 RepID=UPI002621ED96|nr:hypothetical protein [uncultured Arcobacter sp.]
MKTYKNLQNCKNVYMGIDNNFNILEEIYREIIRVENIDYKDVEEDIQDINIVEIFYINETHIQVIYTVSRGSKYFKSLKRKSHQYAVDKTPDML